MNSNEYRETVKEQFLLLLNNPALKEYWLGKGYMVSEMYDLFLDKFGYKPYGGIFYDEIWSSDKNLIKSPNKDEVYPDGYCFRIRNHKGRDITFLSSIYNTWKKNMLKDTKSTVVKKVYNDDIVFVDCELRVLENKLTNNSFMKFCDLRHLKKEINKYIDLSERWIELNKHS